MAQKIALLLLTQTFRNQRKALALLRRARHCDSPELPEILHALVHISHGDSHWVLNRLPSHPALHAILESADTYATTADEMLAASGEHQELLFWRTCYQGMLFVSCVQENITKWRGVTPAAADLLHQRALEAHAANTQTIRNHLEQAESGILPPSSVRRRVVTWQLERHTDLFGKYVRLIVARVAPGTLRLLPPPPLL